MALAAPGGVDHVRAVRGGVENRADPVRGRPVALCIEELERHQADTGAVDPRDADPVVADRSDRAGDVRAVAVVVGRVAVAVGVVPATPVVDVAVSVVVDPVRSAARAALAGVRPHP
jgi:hypothetical protein